MPLRCFDPTLNRSIHAFDLTANEWQLLARDNRLAGHLRMPCCSAPVTLKRSKRGTQFFAHKARGECNTAPETEAHLLLKRLAVEVARNHGWEADTEVAEGEWRADVLARKGAATVAIEIQWSAQTNEETLRRQARYAEAGVRGLWLMRHGGFPVDFSLPAARVAGNAEEGFTAFVPNGGGEQSLPMRDFLEAAFSGRFKFGLPIGFPARVSIRAVHMFCWKCGAETQIMTGVDVAVGPNHYQFSAPDLGAHPGLFEVVRALLPDENWISTIKRRFSKTQGRSYLSNGCSHCDALLGERFEHEVWDEQREICSFTIRIDDLWRQALEAHVGHENAWGVYPSE